MYQIAAANRKIGRKIHRVRLCDLSCVERYGVNVLVVPANVVLIAPDGPRIATVNAENELIFRPVKIGRDLGRELEVLTGITAEDSLVSSPSDALAEGEKVLTRVLPDPKGTASKAANAGAVKPEKK